MAENIPNTSIITKINLIFNWKVEDQPSQVPVKEMIAFSRKQNEKENVLKSCRGFSVSVDTHKNFC